MYRKFKKFRAKIGLSQNVIRLAALRRPLDPSNLCTVNIWASRCAVRTRNTKQTKKKKNARVENNEFLTGPQRNSVRDATTQHKIGRREVPVTRCPVLAVKPMFGPVPQI